jgi:hypothetical protein
MTNRQVAFALGVGNAKSLRYLGGAVNGARAFHDWATRFGYESTCLTDEDENVPLTIPRFESELNKALLAPGKPPIHRLVLYFAGHGLIHEAEQALWLLSDWYDSLRVVAVEPLRRRLYFYNIGQIAIFYDCCRVLPSTMTALTLEEQSVLGRGPTSPNANNPRIDKFIAAQDGAAAFNLPGPNPSDDRCLFTGVLMEGLWGTQSSAFSKLVPGKVTSQSLGDYLDSEVPQRASSYKCTLVPTVIPTFPNGDDIYFDSGTAPSPPALPPWPSPADVAAMGIAVAGDANDLAAGGALDRVTKGPSFNISDAGRWLRGMLGSRASIRERSVPDVPDVAALAGAGEITPALSLEQLRGQPRPAAFETGAGFAVAGGDVSHVWTPDGVFAESHGQSNWWRIGQQQGYQLANSAPVLLEFADGKFAAVAAMPQFIATVLRDARGVSALIYREIHMPSDSAENSEKAIVALENGGLRANDAIDLAVKLRQWKHVDPVLGVISAYLYDSIGDLDNIRRMACYYVQNGQAIPYDIALLAQLQGKLVDGRRLFVEVPPVAGRRPRTQAESQHDWTYEATAAVRGEVGGLWPWLRQGWAFMDDPADDGSSLVLPGVIALRAHLTPARFTTLDAAGGQRLAEIFGLFPRSGN